MIDFPKILRIPGWALHPNDKTVNAIIKRCIANNGICPCVHDEWNESTPLEDKLCPCATYRNGEGCHCGLYVKIQNN